MKVERSNVVIILWESLTAKLVEPDVIFTLSSHEPFEFPGAYKFGTTNQIDKFKSAHAHTDKAVGGFVEAAKKKEWRDNTLLIIIADHGH